MNNIKKVAFVTSENPLDQRSWSGIYYRMYQNIKLEFDIVESVRPNRFFLIIFVLRVYSYIKKQITGKKYDYAHSRLLGKLYGKSISKRLQRNQYDAIFAPTGSLLIAYLKTDIPIFYFSDTTYNLMANYYEVFTNLTKKSIKEGNEIERNAIANSKASIFASSWAANSAIKDYGVSKDNVYIIKMGANIDFPPKSINIDEKLENKVCNILFVGVNWERKGGDIAYQAFRKMREYGIDTTVTVCGCIPPYQDEHMKVYPFLDKNKEGDFDIFIKLWEEAHFLILPTRAECAGIVFCEASSFGIPIITTDTGGVCSYVENNVTGYTLSISASPQEYAEKMKNLWSDKNKYKKMSQQARKKYFDELNWEVWSSKIKNVMSQ